MDICSNCAAMTGSPSFSVVRVSFLRLCFSDLRRDIKRITIRGFAKFYSRA